MCELIIRQLGLQEYESVYLQMREFTHQRTSNSADEIWCLQHSPVFTLGANADPKHILSKTDIPIIQSDRGGQVTYHGPGQVILYLMIDLKRKSLGVKSLVEVIEQSVVSLLKRYNINSQARTDAHGVYVNDAKIASLGLRIHRACSYHGVALNVDMDLSPFGLINPCGFEDLPVTQIVEHAETENTREISTELTEILYTKLDYKIEQISIYDK